MHQHSPHPPLSGGCAYRQHARTPIPMRVRERSCRFKRGALQRSAGPKKQRLRSLHWPTPGGGAHNYFNVNFTLKLILSLKGPTGGAAHHRDMTHPQPSGSVGQC